MRLSEAIRLGSLAIQNPQAGFVSVCAIGMGCAAIGVKRGYDELAMAWPWTSLRAAGGGHYVTRLWLTFDDKVMIDRTMTIEQLCDIVAGWERELAAQGINVEQVTMAAPPETTRVPDSEHSKVLCD